MSTWALIGSPNCGKTTLYNWLTGAKSKAVNYPGSTIEYSVGALRAQLAEKHDAASIRFVDTPGIYSLSPESEDEQVTHDVLFSDKKVESLDGLLVVLDATQLQRHLVIAKQVLESGYKCLFVVTMNDLVLKQNSSVNLDILKSELKSDVVLFDGVLGGGLDQIIESLKSTAATDSNLVHEISWPEEKQVQALQWAHHLNKKVIEAEKVQTAVSVFTQKMDYWLLHPIFGFVAFFAIMTFLFASIYWVAQPFMDLIDENFSALATYATENISGLTGEFIGSGLIAAIGGVVIFIPQILILFFVLGLLEASGYLARVAALIDKPLSYVGLGGRSFVPMLSGFACAIPAIMATRNISSKKEKLIAQSIIPFMTCSARLPVYSLMIGFLYGDENPLMAGFVMALLYLGAIVVGAIAAHAIETFIVDKTKSRLLMELPLYRRPRIRLILFQSLTKVKAFLFKAGPIIFVLALVLWFATNFPRHEEGASTASLAQHSYAAQIGHAIEPVFTPMGVDWRVGFGIISAFAAREVFVSSLALMFNIESDDEGEQSTSLLQSMKTATFEDGSPIFTTASVTGILIFFMIALQCTSTVGILKREMGSWKPALLQLLFSNLFAYCLAVSVVFIMKGMGL